MTLPLCSNEEYVKDVKLTGNGVQADSASTEDSAVKSAKS